MQKAANLLVATPPYTINVVMYVPFGIGAITLALTILWNGL